MTQKSRLRLPGMSRRDVVKAGLAAGVVAAAPGYMRTAGAAAAIRRDIELGTRVILDHLRAGEAMRGSGPVPHERKTR